MIGILDRWKHLALAVALAGGMAGLGVPQAQARAWTSPASRSHIRKVQQQLKKDGYYKGAVDGIDGPQTRAAILKFQRSNNLTATGRLDRATRSQLGMRVSGEAARAVATPSAPPSSAPGTPSATPSSPNMTTPPSMGMTLSSNTIKAAQRQLKQQGFYTGDVSGVIGSKTQEAIRQYQKANNLNATGQLDQATLKSLGVSTSQ